MNFCFIWSKHGLSCVEEEVATPLIRVRTRTTSGPCTWHAFYSFFLALIKLNA